MKSEWLWSAVENNKLVSWKGFQQLLPSIPLLWASTTTTTTTTTQLTDYFIVFATKTSSKGCSQNWAIHGILRLLFSKAQGSNPMAVWIKSRSSTSSILFATLEKNRCIQFHLHHLAIFVNELQIVYSTVLLSCTYHLPNRGLRHPLSSFTSPSVLHFAFNCLVTCLEINFCLSTPVTLSFKFGHTQPLFSLFSTFQYSC